MNLSSGTGWGQKNLWRGAGGSHHYGSQNAKQLFYRLKKKKSYSFLKRKLGAKWSLSRSLHAGSLETDDHASGPEAESVGVSSQEGTESSRLCPLGSERCPQSHPEGTLLGNHETPNTLRFC